MCTTDSNNLKITAQEAYEQAEAKNKTLADSPKDDRMKLFYKGKQLKMIHIDDIRDIVNLGRDLYPLDFALSLKNIWDLEAMSADKHDLQHNYIYVRFVFGLARAMGYGVR
ncbi:MAG: hypothetical protein LUD81_10415 [Clostridiales bacterium]|nr:hypothetical protein [Clostridiales bacterium]